MVFAEFGRRVRLSLNRLMARQHEGGSGDPGFGTGAGLGFRAAVTNSPSRTHTLFSIAETLAALQFVLGRVSHIPFLVQTVLEHIDGARRIKRPWVC